MATATLTIFPYIYVNSKGVYSFAGATEGDTQPTDTVNTDGSFMIYLPPHKIQIDWPDDVRNACTQLLRQHREKIKLAHGQLLVQMQAQENQLLGLEAPEVLDAVPKAHPYGDLSRCTHCEKPKSKHFEVDGHFFCTEAHDDSTTFEEDDIPF